PRGRAIPTVGSPFGRFCHGSGHQPSRLRGDRIGLIRAPLSARQTAQLSGPSDQRSAGLEHRHLVPGLGRPQYGSSPADPTRCALRSRCRVHGRHVLAVLAERTYSTFLNATKVHPINHSGEFFTVPGAALTHPGPQRTPFLFQAGASPRGQQFALDHAEAIFVTGSSPRLVRHWVDQIRNGLEARGRDRYAIKIFAMVTIVVADTDHEAQQRLDSYAQYVDTESALTLFGGWTGVDLAGTDPDSPIEYVTTEANRSALESMTKLAGAKTWTVRDLAEFVAIGGRGPVLVGSASTVADELVRWQTEADLDGFNVSAAVRPADLQRVAHYLTPELKRRGLLLQRPDTPTTLRETMTGAK